MQRGARRQETEPPVSIEGPPLLARMAAVMALFDLVWNRLVVRIANATDQDAAVALMRAGVFPRNLAAVAGLVALVTGLFTFLRMAGYSGLGRRLAISSLAGVLTPAFVLALVIPKERVSILVVVVALGASNALVFLLGTVAVQYQAGARRWAAGLAMLGGAMVLTVLVDLSVRSIAQTQWSVPIGLIAHHTGEIVWHLVPMVVLYAMFRPPISVPRSEGAPPSRVALGIAGGVVVLVLCLSLGGAHSLHTHRFATLVYGALRLTLAPESLAWLNGLPVGVAFAAALVGLASSSPGRSQLGAAVALWLSAGYAPRAPGQLLDFALAGLLLARAAQAASVEGRARTRIRWAPITEPDAPPP